MPTIRKLEPEEVQTIENKGKGLRKLTEEQYDQFLADFGTGDYGEAVLEPNEKRLTIRNRLKAAAARHGVDLHFMRTTGDMMRFKVISRDGQTAEQPAPAVEPESVPVASTRRRRRRGVADARKNKPHSLRPGSCM
jgi:hypothetical protein